MVCFLARSFAAIASAVTRGGFPVAANARLHKIDDQIASGHCMSCRYDVTRNVPPIPFKTNGYRKFSTDFVRIARIYVTSLLPFVWRSINQQVNAEPQLASSQFAGNDHGNAEASGSTHVRQRHLVAQTAATRDLADTQTHLPPQAKYPSNSTHDNPGPRHLSASRFGKPAGNPARHPRRRAPWVVTFSRISGNFPVKYAFCRRYWQENGPPARVRSCALILPPPCRSRPLQILRVQVSVAHL